MAGRSRRSRLQNDILGNRTWRNNVYSGTGATRYDWDILNRMLLCANATSGSTYSYRADGQRIEKVDGVTLSWTGNRESGHYDTNYATSRPTYRYFYDGQMGIEDDYNPSGTVTKVNRYGLGARGIDRVEKYADSTTTYGYPLYDGHGNMRTTLARSGSSYSTGTFKTSDVWGSVRSGGDSGDPAQKYVANLGHVNDPESGLVYMRARYHEPATGRFVSEDPAMDGANWYVYCASNPVSMADRSGREPDDDSFDPVYLFRWGMWWKSYYANIGTMPIRVLLGFLFKGPLGAATAYILFGLVVAYQGAVVTELYSLRILAWWMYLFDELPDGTSLRPRFGTFALDFYDESPGGSW